MSIVMNNIEKNIDGFNILKISNLCIEKGEICALIGSNGAGKTTLINCLLGLINPEQGTIKINNELFQNNERSQILSQIGSVLQYPTSISKLTINQLFTEHFHYLNLKKPTSWDKFLENVNLNVSPNLKIGKMSLGMKQRLLVALALSHNPNILILDEPFNGLDPDGIILIKNLITSFKNCGGIILISSHSLGELEDFTTSVVFIKNGQTFEKIYMKLLLDKYKGGLQEYYKEFSTGGTIIE